MSNETIMLVKIGIINDLQKQGFLTEKQQKEAIRLINKKYAKERKENQC